MRRLVTRVFAAESFVTGWGRYVTERTIASLADHTPAAVARGAANSAGLLDPMLTLRGLRLYRELAATHDAGFFERVRLIVARCQTDYIGIVDLKRVKGRRDAATLQHVNGVAVMQHVEAGRPLLVLGLHFPFFHSACGPLSLASGPAAAIGKSVAAREGRKGGSAAARDEFFMNHVVYPAVSRLGEVMYVTWQPQDDMRTARALVRKARQPGFVGIILIDAPGAEWDEFVRPFAGFESRGFPLGAVRMAALAGCAVVPLVAVPGKRGTTNLHWGRLIGPDEVRERDPQAVMSEMVDHLEWGVGAFRFAYGPSAGIERRWDSASGLWTSRHPGAASVESQVARDGDERESSAPAASTTR